MDSLVSYEVGDDTAVVTMNDGKANALSFNMFEQINAALDQGERDDVVIVLQGREGVFCGGFDLKSLDEKGALPRDLVQHGLQLSLRLLEYPRPVVIACTGHAVAMGALLLLCADYRIGVDGPFRVVLNEVSIGMELPWAAIEMARHRLTPAYFARALNLAEPFAPAIAVEAGFIDEVVGASDLLTSSRVKASELASLPPITYRSVKQRSIDTALRAIRIGVERDEHLRE